jgi:hypothetical protein
MKQSRSKVQRTFIFACLTAGLVLSGCAAAAPETPEVQLPTSTVQALPDPSAIPLATENPFGDWSEYRNEGFGFRVLFPTAWFGPEVSESEGSLRLEVGSDQVYPYGTDRTEQITTIPDSYYIIIQYFENSDGKSWDDYISSGWIDTYQGLLDMEDGGSISTARSLAIRVKEVNLGSFQGLEYIVTLPEGAQTERVYLREIMAFDDELNWLRITGSPNLVEIADPADWKADFSRVDQSNLEIFNQLAGSLEIK